ncbi:hypothetical protein ACFLTA_07370 [Bacteroidota bacterium]
MNYYGYIKGGTGNGGLIDIFPFLTWDINHRHSLEGKIHFFSLANSILLENQIRYDLKLETEYDGRYNFKLNPEFTLTAGVS